MGGYTDINMDQGADYFDTLNLTADDGSPVNVVGYTFSSQMRRSFYSANASANLTVAVQDGPNGIISFSMPANTSMNLTAGRYLYDVYMVDTSNTTTRIIEGTIVLSNQATLGNNKPIQPFGNS